MMLWMPAPSTIPPFSTFAAGRTAAMVNFRWRVAPAGTESRTRDDVAGRERETDPRSVVTTSLLTVGWFDPPTRGRTKMLVSDRSP